jgi:peptidoglycan lytic transglycosylase G
VLKRILWLFVLLILAGGVVAGLLYVRVDQPYRGYATPDQFIEIPQGAGSRTIGDRLVAAGVIRDFTTYRIALYMSGQGRHLQAGDYRFDRPMTPFEVIDKIARGDVVVITVTFPEGLSIVEMSKIFEANGLGKAAEFVAAARDPAPIRDLDPEARDLEGYLFPDTYPLSRKTDAAQLVRLMVQRFAHAFSTDVRQKAADRSLSVRQAATLASIVEKETGRAEERPLVAAVYANRLRIGMPLQCDPTVIYAMQRAGTYHGNLKREDLSMDSPYNTYRYPGLPPGPIASPGRAALGAAVQPAQVDYLYFVSKNDGSHAFASTLVEHNKNVQKFQVEYFRERRAGKP